MVILSEVDEKNCVKEKYRAVPICPKQWSKESTRMYRLRDADYRNGDARELPVASTPC